MSASIRVLKVLLLYIIALLLNLLLLYIIARPGRAQHRGDARGITRPEVTVRLNEGEPGARRASLRYRFPKGGFASKELLMQSSREVFVPSGPGGRAPAGPAHNAHAPEPVVAGGNLREPPPCASEQASSTAPAGVK